MSKTLCIIGMAISLVVFLLFLADISIKVPFGRNSLVLDSVFIVASLVMAAMGFFTYREQ